MVSIRKRRYQAEKAKLEAASNKCTQNAESMSIAENKAVEFMKPSSYSFKTPYKGNRGIDLKKRKLHRRKMVNGNPETCMLRGVYFKNCKWQAAIKVGKKQVHLGTVNTQEEAAHLYDRAAYMCGRDPNFQLPEEEKLELQTIEWDEFLALTKKDIQNKKMQNKLEAQKRRQAAMMIKTTPPQA